MSIRQQTFGRSRRRRRTTALALLVVALLAVGALFLSRGCGPGEAPEASGAREGGAQNAGEERRAGGPGDEGASGGDRRREETDGPKKPEKPKEPEQPFAVVPPSQDEAAVRSPENGLDSNALEAMASGGQPQTATGDQYGAGGAAEETTAGFEDAGAEQSGSQSGLQGRTLVEGVQDRSDGPLKDHRLVAYYGHPWVAQMGILGEYEPRQLMERLKTQAAAYSAADPGRPAVPMIELIASVAQRDPGPDGLYVTQTPKEEIERYSRLAKENGALLMLDVQLGRATVQQEIEILRPYLKEPYVHLAIDTEYSVEAGQVPGVNLGTVDGPELQGAVRWLDELVEKENLPDKMLLVHQFEDGIVTNKDAVKPTDDVQVVLHADGFGGPEAKFTKYRQLVRDQPIQYGGFKVFYRQDAPVLNPEQVLTLDPAPAIVTYQ